jgi:hypothetical protein
MQVVHCAHTVVTCCLPACRAACDSRSADVFASVFYLPKPRPLNYLINELWRGPTAVIQGVLDPLNDAQVGFRGEVLGVLSWGVYCCFFWQRALDGTHCGDPGRAGQYTGADYGCTLTCTAVCCYAWPQWGSGYVTFPRPVVACPPLQATLLLCSWCSRCTECAPVGLECFDLLCIAFMTPLLVLSCAGPL